MVVRMIITLDSGVETGGQPGVHRSQKPGTIAPEVGTPEDPDEGI